MRGHFASSNAPLLSSKTVEIVLLWSGAEYCKFFDSSLSRNEPFSFQLGRGMVIRGWDEGITYFNKGAEGKIYIPSPLGYGAAGAGGVIPPNAVLIFEIQVLDY